MLDQLHALQTQALADLNGVKNRADLDAWDSHYIGKKGQLTQLLRNMGSLSKEERPIFGKLANEVKSALETAYDERNRLISEQELAQDLESGAVDITLPGRPNPTGGLHPSTRTLRRFYDIWGDMGFQVYQSRDIETDDMNFSQLNIPPHHPARDMQDTFYTT
ncbi:MAG TPA: hypothetical protein PLZ51_07560, partial [Aggregatilineales bacterium]|nr:hypothetical protein [Aggregatilineales bacterium]